jgi:hypothetical protein
MTCGAAEQKNGRAAISAIVVSVKKSLVHLIRRPQVFPVLGWEVVERQ